jgi:hypothetical protein
MRATVLALVLLPFAALAEPVALIDRPLVLPRGAFELNLMGNITNEDTAATSLTGEVLGLGLEFGLGNAQFGIAGALPVNPGFGVGSLLASAAFALAPRTALRLDFGVEHFGVNGAAGGSGTLVYGAIGVPFQVRLSRSVSLVSGRVGALRFAHFSNVGTGGVGVYTGASAAPFESSDLITITNELNGSSLITLNAPIGFLLQVAEPFAITLRSGVEVFIPTSGGDPAAFLPIGIDAVLSAGPLDIGASFSLAGYVGGNGSVAGPGYGDIRMGVLWLRFRA